MSINAYVPGEVARLSLSATDAAGVAADPGALRLIVKAPSGTLASHTFGVGEVVVKSAAGKYHADVHLVSAGVWAYRWELDVPNAGAAEGVINVLKSRVI